MTSSNERDLRAGSGRVGGAGGGLALLLSLPFVVELARKYVWYSDLVFVIQAGILASWTLLVAGKVTSLHRRLDVVYVFGLAYLAVAGAVTFFQPGASIGGFMVGLHALVLPLLYFIVSYRLSNQIDDPVMVAVKTVSSWSAAVLGIATVQLVLGPEHPINRLPGDLGLGVYAFSGAASGHDVFRPASIFLHTGKLGHVAFGLAIFKLAVLVERASVPRWLLPSALVEVVLVAVTGQRAAWILLLSLILVAGLTRSLRSRVRLAGLGVLLAGLPVVLTRAGGGGFVNALGGRFEFTIATLGRRLSSTLVRPWGPVLDDVGLFGAGFGMFTSGSDAFGGRPLYVAVTEGLPEGTWHRVLGETGITGVALFAGMLVAFAWVVYRSRRECDSDRAAGATFLLWWIAAMAVWGFIHDVFADSTAVALALAIGAAGLPGRSRRRSR